MPSVKRERGWDDDAYEDGDDNDLEDVEQDEEDGQQAAAAQGGPNAGLSGSWRSLGRKSRTNEHFAKGAVKEIKVHNFMTYSGPLTIRPGPRLNLVLGPNGTGKSSLVCALCIGLNGSPKTLGRADDLKDYVRRGFNSFWIEITLSSGGQGRDYVVKRVVKLRHDGENMHHESKWTLNGRDTTAREVDKLVKQLNIQFGNLCQFLPQDKVAQFSAMDKYELLASTQKALGDSSLYDMHQQLVQLRKDERQAAADRDTTAGRLAKLEAEQERQQRDYERFQERERLQEEAQSLRCQAKWLEVVAKGRAAAAAKQQLEARRGELQDLEAQQEEDTRPIRAREEAIKATKLEKVAVERQGREVDSRMRRIRDKLDANEVETSKLADELASLEDQAKRRQADIAAARQRLAEAQEELRRAPERPSQDMVERAEQLGELFSAARREAAGVEGQRNNLASQMQGLQAEIGHVLARRGTLDSRKHQVLQKLQSAGHRNITKLHHWLEGHRADGTFRGPVLGPLALELSVRGSNPLAVQVVENSCWKWLGSYLVTCKEDELTLEARVRAMDVWNVKVVATSYDPDTPYQPAYPAGTAAQHAGYGIQCTVDELIEAPPIIMHALNEQCKLDRVFIGNDHTAASMEAISQHTSINTVLVGTMRYGVVRSRYSATRTISTDELYAVRVLGAGGGAEEDAERATLAERERALIQERDALQAESDELGSRLVQLEQQMQQYELEGKQLDQKRQNIVKRRGQLIGSEQTALRQLNHKEAAPDPESRRPVLRQAIQEKVAGHVSLCGELLSATRQAWAAMQAAQLLELRLSERSAQLEALQGARKQREDSLHAATNAVQDAQKRFEELLEESRRAKARAQEDYPPKDSDKKAIKEHEASNTAPGALLAKAEQKEAEAEQVVCSNQNVVNEYRKRQADIAQLKTSLGQHEAELQGLRGRLEHLKNQWLPQIQSMVATINASFSSNFKEIGCAGEVRLHMEEDYDKFAIEILVQFRADEEMQLLTSTRQSGGERAVSTVLYLIALQAVTETPFRVVDEINQGMDAHNERKVIRHLLVASTAANTPQIFMMTPKLLPNLTYTRDIVVLQINSGNYLEPGLDTGHISMREGMFGKRYCQEHPRE